MNHSTPGLPFHHQLPEPTQTHVHWVSDAIQPSHPLSSPSSCPQSFPASGSFQMSQLFAWGGQSIGVSASTSVLPMNIQDWSPLGWTGWISLQSKGLWRVFSNTTVQKHQFFGAQLYVASLVVQRLKRLPAMQATWVQSLGREDPLEKEMATHSSILAWRTPMYGGAFWATVHGVTKSRTRLSNFTFNFSFLYSPTLTSIHDYWKNHTLDQTDLCWQSNVSAF